MTPPAPLTGCVSRGTVGCRGTAEPGAASKPSTPRSVSPIVDDEGRLRAMLRVAESADVTQEELPWLDFCYALPSEVAGDSQADNGVLEINSGGRVFFLVRSWRAGVLRRAAGTHSPPTHSTSQAATADDDGGSAALVPRAQVLLDAPRGPGRAVRHGDDHAHGHRGAQVTHPAGDCSECQHLGKFLAGW